MRSWKSFLRFCVIIMAGIIIYACPVFANGVEVSREELKQLKETTRLLKERIQELEKRLQEYERSQGEIIKAREEREELKSEVKELKKVKDILGHIEISGGVTGVLQGTANNDKNNPEGDSTDAAFTIDLNLATHFGEYGSFYIHLEGGDGEGVNDDVKSFSVPNYDAYNTRNQSNQADVTISEAFYEFSFFDERFLVDAGKMDISVLFDENEAAGDETAQFLSNIFVKSMGLTIPEPDNFYCPGFMFKVSTVDLLEFRIVGAAVEDDNWEDVFDHGFLAGQINLKPDINGRQGNYRFYVRWDNRNHLKNQDLTTANNRATPSYDDPLADEDQKGWGISFDQEIVKGVTGFVRYSQTDDDLARWNGDDGRWEMIPFDRLWTAGLEVSGIMWNREDDALGAAYGQTLLTDDYEAANSNTDNEGYMEAYYRLALHERFSLSGDVQWVQNPGGDSSADDIYIFGLRTQLDF